MGGRGSESGLNSGDSGKTSAELATEVTGSDGATIDLSDNPLVYGDKDPNMTDAVRKTIEEFEDKRWNNKIEYGRLVGADGGVLQDAKGNKDYVAIRVDLANMADAYSHNHPRSGYETGCLGGTFSEEDMDVFRASGMRTFRATASEGTYSISRLSSFDALGFKSYYKSELSASRKRFNDVCKKNRAKYNAARKKANEAMFDAIQNKGATYSEATEIYNKACDKAFEKLVSVTNKAFNAHLVEDHNIFLAGQEKYGYYYALERRQ